MPASGGTVVVGFVPTSEGEAAVAAAIEQARLTGGRVVIVRSYKDESGEAHDRALDLRLSWQAAHDSLVASGIAFEVREIEGSAAPAGDLLATAADVDATLIVIGLRRRSPVGKLLMGSNAQDVLLRADCPVLAVKSRNP
jgi:nucleotide-binding universal stress UspA family protein